MQAGVSGERPYPRWKMADSLEIGRDLIVREAVYLDERRWDDWLALFTEDCEYWVPTWRTEEALTSDPQAEISHIYYANRAGLEDRIVRIRSGRSPASVPLRRTTHVVGNFLLAGAKENRLSGCVPAGPATSSIRTTSEPMFFRSRLLRAAPQGKILADREEEDHSAERLSAFDGGYLLHLDRLVGVNRHTVFICTTICSSRCLTRLDRG